MSTQLSIPSEVSHVEVARKRSLGAAIELCANVAGHDLDKTLQQALGVDKAQFSRWQSGTEGILWHKLVKLMDTCGNDAPLLWMLNERGYDLASVRKRESELQRENREQREEIVALRRALASKYA
jgi:plasmid maintenance system antidote protein VapI